MTWKVGECSGNNGWQVPQQSGQAGAAQQGRQAAPAGADEEVLTTNTCIRDGVTVDHSDHPHELCMQQIHATRTGMQNHERLRVERQWRQPQQAVLPPPVPQPHPEPVRFAKENGEASAGERLWKATKQTASDVVEFSGGMVRGAAASITMGAMGAPEPTDSGVSRAGQVIGSEVVGLHGVQTATGGGGAGLVLAPETGGASLVPAAVAVGVGTWEAVGAAKNLAEIAGTPMQMSTSGEASNSSGASRTQPTLEPDLNRTPNGKRTTWGLKDDPTTIDGRTRENTSADVMSKAGFDVEQNPAVSPDDLRRNLGVKEGANPDYKIGGAEGRLFDCLSPNSEDPFGIRNKIADKVSKGQATRIVLNLDGNPVLPEAIKQELITTPVDKLQEVMIVKDGAVVPFFP